MKIELRTVKVRDLIADYKDAQEKGVTAWGGLLDVRPAYQREFIYKDKQRDAVIDTLSKGFPLNTMYWVKANDGSGHSFTGRFLTLFWRCCRRQGLFPKPLCV